MGLLMACLEGVVPKNPSTPLENNIYEVVSSQRQRRPSLITNLARDKLYDVLYKIIEHESKNSELNMAIGMALASAIKGEISGLSANDPRIVALREKLRGEIRAALDPSPSAKVAPYQFPTQAKVPEAFAGRDKELLDHLELAGYKVKSTQVRKITVDIEIEDERNG
jgi:hypothetical protein